jgi:hypothetical protein
MWLHVLGGVCPAAALSPNSSELPFTSLTDDELALAIADALRQAQRQRTSA